MLEAYKTYWFFLRVDMNLVSQWGRAKSQNENIPHVSRILNIQCSIFPLSSCPTHRHRAHYKTALGMFVSMHVCPQLNPVTSRTSSSFIFFLKWSASSKCIYVTFDSGMGSCSYRNICIYIAPCKWSFCPHLIFKQAFCCRRSVKQAHL